MSRRRHDRWLLIRLAAQNVGRRRLRAIFLGIAVMLGVGIGFASFVAGWALREGMARSFSRMGADLLVVPRATLVNITASLLTVMFTSVARGTTRRSAPMREKLRAMPSRSAQPATKLAKPIPTPSITATPRKIARSGRRPTFCAARRMSSQRSCQRPAIQLLSEQNLAGLIDLHAEVMRAAGSRVDDLHQPAMRVA